MKNLILLLYTLVFSFSLLLSSRCGLAHAAEQNASGLAKATFAGGCFWCMEKPFEALKGVKNVVSGYIGGTTKNPDYHNYAAGGHVEAIEITYDPAVISFEQLLEVYWRQIDPTDPDGQFVDRGHAYTSAIFYHTEEQKAAAEKSKQTLAESKIFTKPIVTPILPATTFYPAEEYHQDYYRKNPIRYKFYRYGSGRDQFLDKTWGPEHNEDKGSK